MNPKLSLHIVLVLTFIGSGLSCLAYLMAGFFYDTFQHTLAVIASANAEMAVSADLFAAFPRLLFIAQGVFYGISLLGAIAMWNLSKSGFHAYTLSQLVLLALPMVFMGKAYFAIGDAMLTLLFVTYYYFSLRRLGAFSRDDNPSDDNTCNKDRSLDDFKANNDNQSVSNTPSEETKDIDQ